MKKTVWAPIVIGGLAVVGMLGVPVQTSLFAVKAFSFSAFSVGSLVVAGYVWIKG